MAKIAFGKSFCISAVEECCGCSGGCESLIVLEKDSSMSSREIVEVMLDFKCRLRVNLWSRKVG